jgi:FeS assembly SUF system protein
MDARNMILDTFTDKYDIEKIGIFNLRLTDKTNQNVRSGFSNSIELNHMSESMDTANLGEKIVNVLKTIFDPEIPVDIYELGLIYDVFVNEDSDVKILMTLTTPNCPVAESLPMEVEEKVKSLDEVKTAEVEITFDPPWTQDLMSEEAKLELGML